MRYERRKRLFSFFSGTSLGAIPVEGVVSDDLFTRRRKRERGEAV
jgi:hypothetical protein